MKMFFQWVAPAEGVSSITLVNTPAPGIHHHLFCTHQLFIISSLCIIPSSMPLTLMELLIITTWLLQVPHHVNKIIMSLIIIIITLLIHPGASREHHLPPVGWRELQTGLRALPRVSWHHWVTIFIMIIIIVIGWPSLSWSSTCKEVHRHFYSSAFSNLPNDNARSLPAAWFIFTMIVLLIIIMIIL